MVGPEKIDVPSFEVANETIDYIADIANESFKRQLELDESVWRSLPFFSAVFAFVAAVVGKSAVDLPPWGESHSGKAAFLMLVFAVGSLAWSLRWFWVVLRPREYEYPSPDREILEYAKGIWQFHLGSGVSDTSKLDEKTLAEVRLLMIDQYGSAAATNREHNAVKLKARLQVLLFIMLAFALAFACQATMFINTHVGAKPAGQGVLSDGTQPKPHSVAATSGGEGAPPSSSQAGASKIGVGEGGRELLGGKHQAGGQEQALTRSPRVVAPLASRDTHPANQTFSASGGVVKDRVSENGAIRSVPIPPERKD